MAARNLVANHGTDQFPELLTVEVLAEKWHLKPGTIRAWASRARSSTQWVER